VLLLWLAIAAHAGHAEKLQSLLAEGRGDDVRKQCTSKHWYTEDTEYDVREACAQAFRMPLDRGGTPEQWETFGERWKGTSSAMDTEERAADAAMLLATEPSGWQEVADRYPTTSAGRTANRQIIDLELAAVQNAKQAAAFVKKHPKHLGSDRLIFDYPSTFFTLTPGPKLSWRDPSYKRRLTVTWAVVAPRGKAYILKDGLAELMNRYGFSGLKGPDCAPGAPWKAGILVSTRDYSRVFDTIQPDICKGEPLLLGMEQGKVTFIDEAPLHYERGVLDHPEGEVLLPEAPGAAHGSNGAVLQSVSDGVYLSTPLAPCLPARVKRDAPGVPISPRAPDGERAVPPPVRLALNLVWQPPTATNTPSNWAVVPGEDPAQALASLETFGVTWAAETAMPLGDDWWVVPAADGFGTAIVGPEGVTLLAEGMAQVRAATTPGQHWLHIHGVIRRLDRGHWCQQ
jgi:hypothetical protein